MSAPTGGRRLALLVTLGALLTAAVIAGAAGAKNDHKNKPETTKAIFLVADGMRQDLVERYAGRRRHAARWGSCCRTARPRPATAC